MALKTGPTGGHHEDNVHLHSLHRSSEPALVWECAGQAGPPHKVAELWGLLASVAHSAHLFLAPGFQALGPWEPTELAPQSQNGSTVRRVIAVHTANQGSPSSIP